MKIPQRQDQVSLEAPRTAAGNVPEPTTAGLGNSYIKTMQGLSKSLQDISDLQFKLSMNATEAQIDRFNLYTAERTKQYEQELSLATTQEQIQNLFVNYKKDIDENGINTLGAELYSGWYSREGGQKVATAEYTGSLASAQLQIALNKQALEDAGRKYNEFAFEAQNPEDRQKYIDAWEDMLGRYVENGTISESEKQSIQRNWNLNLIRTIVQQDMYLHPEETAEKLRKDKDYAPIITGEERLRLANEAMELAARRKNTGQSTVVQVGAEAWRTLFWSKDQKEGKNNRDAAMKIYNIFSKDQEQAKKILAKWNGKDVKEISFEDVMNTRAKMEATIDIKNEERRLNFINSLDKAKEEQNALFTLKKMGKTKEDKGKIVSTETLSGEKLYAHFLQGDLKDSLSQTTQLVNSHGRYKMLLSDQIARVYAEGDKALYKDILSKQRENAILYAKGIRASKEVLEDNDGLPWQKQMRQSFKAVFEAIDKTPNGTKEIQENNMGKFVNNVWNAYDPSSLFDPNAKFDDAKTKEIVSNIEFCLAEAGLPTEYAKIFFDKTNSLKQQGLVRKILDSKGKPYGPFSSAMMEGYF